MYSKNCIFVSGTQHIVWHAIGGQSVFAELDWISLSFESSAMNKYFSQTSPTASIFHDYWFCWNSKGLNCCIFSNQHACSFHPFSLSIYISHSVFLYFTSAGGIGYMHFPMKLQCCGPIATILQSYIFF